MGIPRLIFRSILAATTLCAVADVAQQVVKERQLIKAASLTAGVADHRDWCQREVEVAIRADNAARFRGDRIELQRMLGRVRAIFQLECPIATTIRISGLVDNVFVYDGFASAEGKWILQEIPALLTQEYIDAPAAAPDPAEPAPSQPPIAAVPSPSPGAQQATPKVIAAETCDAVAADPDDPEKPATMSGVRDEAVDASRAINACAQAVKEESDEPRFKFQLARAYLFTDRNEEAIDLLVAAAQDGHGALLAYLGDIMLYGAGGLESEPQIAKSLYLHAAEAGFKPAAQLAADIVADAKPEPQSPKRTALTFHYPDLANAMMAGNRPSSAKHIYGELMGYVVNGLAGVRDECPDVLLKKEWVAVIIRASLAYVHRAPGEATRFNLAMEQGAFDEFHQDAMDDGYAVAVSKQRHGGGDKEFRNRRRRSSSGGLAVMPSKLSLRLLAAVLCIAASLAVPASDMGAAFRGSGPVFPAARDAGDKRRRIFFGAAPDDAETGDVHCRTARRRQRPQPCERAHDKSDLARYDNARLQRAGEQHRETDRSGQRKELADPAARSRLRACTAAFR